MLNSEFQLLFRIKYILLQKLLLILRKLPICMKVSLQ